ncbi:PREDICTED: uncharacterized protein LOC108780109 [Cyphomyrmex costatus]|uniref:uncharacterized protein LOC108780109 n=1 Tax=Cyphomyrmex costatus TaxID=456900 RepID=UPI0008523658|nr:PREDICTED: uncharacterized protein LOC108780109 [Cyphomyrmex costatus]
MPINKFGLSLGGGSESHYQWRGLFRNYVRDNALCRVATDFDAKLRKIRRLALPVDDTDATNKRYVQQSVQDLRFEKRRMSEKRSLVEELHAPARRNFPRRHVIVHGYDDLWQVDVVEMRPYTRFNRGYHYILTVIDVLSKYAWTMPLKAKSGNEVTRAIAKIIRDDRRCPKNLQTDKGKEFYNSDVQKLLKKHNINHYSMYSVMKASVVERFNRTLKNDMWKQFTYNGNYKWIEMLPRLVSDYNALPPAGDRAYQVSGNLGTVYSAIKIAGPAKFKVGDAVRVSKFKTIFEKGFTPNWTTEVFNIIKVQQTNPVTYLLEDSRGELIAGGFYEYELHRVANPDVYLVEKVLRKRGNDVYVKWLGLDKSHNSWIHKDNVL